MDDLLMRSRLSMSVTTGIPAVHAHTSKQQAVQGGASFQQVLEETAQKQELSFSKHAASRVEQREIQLSETGMERLNEGFRIARDKGLSDALILIDGSAFIISAKNGRVITALNGRELQGKVITNIDGTVIL